MRALCLLTFLTLLGACTPQIMPPVSPAEQSDINACKASASSINDPPYSSDNPLWGSYFEMCMQQRGYTAEQLRQIWY